MLAPNKVRLSMCTCGLGVLEVFILFCILDFKRFLFNLFLSVVLFRCYCKWRFLPHCIFQLVVCENYWFFQVNLAEFSVCVGIITDSLGPKV